MITHGLLLTSGGENLPQSDTTRLEDDVEVINHHPAAAKASSFGQYQTWSSHWQMPMDNGMCRELPATMRRRSGNTPP
ncbi:hypothetical protein N7537_006129 [Penicillium hordei]|uniref:Uncharacterized protein n=1 Tax=Penicillium hordei TaxID=40994 RepID=A0AAD6H2T1_9EURO|nr:uncharacterized protein N7537_006129 [Penicillium hordei]KAJ5603173.1 hypothetical protein N7537_006129 [Penicillium hordei]